ncbi:hypothetical protein ABG067_005492 [Albugo candida]
MTKVSPNPKNDTAKESIHIHIKNEEQSFTVETLPEESIAAVKAAYLDSGKCRGHPNLILLLHKGKEVPDEKTLAELGIADGDTLVHIEAKHEPFAPVNYKLLAQSIKNRHRHEQDHIKMLQQDNVWAAGTDGILHRMGAEKGLISTRTHSYSQKPHFNSNKGGSGRTFFNQLSVRVNGCNYHVIPSMEGRWNGETTTVPAQTDGNQVCSCDLLFRSEEGVWSQRQTRTSINGLTTTHHYWIKPVADSILKVESDDPSLRNCDVTMQELGTSILVVTAVSKISGCPIMVETMTVLDSSRRLRSVQRFDESGAFRSVCVLKEHRVLDAVSGAMERFGNVF